jgi:branched-chain amino acid transport system ATP-binding protein
MQSDYENILQVNELSKYFGGLGAVSNCSIKIKKGSITGIIGPNGSGKTTLFNLIAGNLKPSSGTVLFNNEDITSIPSYELFSKGLLRTFQIAHEFTNLTVLENLMMVPGNQSGEKLANALFRPKIVNEEEKIIKKKALEVIEFLNLKHLSQELAGNLSGGQKKLLELGRTMMVDAKLVLLDEVGAGVNRTLLKDIGTAILRLNKEKGYTFCMIEHDMDFISRLCNPVIVMAEGSVLFEGTSEEVKNNEQVIESYLGRGSKKMELSK